MTFRKEILFLAMAMLAAAAMAATADSIVVDYSAGITVNTGSAQFAPHHIASNRGGTVTQQHSVLLSASMRHEMDASVYIKVLV